MHEFPASHILTLTGSPRQRGRIHGESLRQEIHEVILRWKNSLAAYVSPSPDQYIHELVTQTDFMPAIERWTPELLEEVRGIAEAADMEFEDIFAFQLQDEEWWFGEQRKPPRPDDINHCSSISWRGDGHSATLVGQNMDMPSYMDGYQVIMRIQDSLSDLELTVFSTAGLLALNGMNNQSIGIVCNNLSQLNHSKVGLPVAFVLRGALAKKSFIQARDFLETLPHASGQNYILGSKDRLIDLECSANQVTRYAHSADSQWILHTNHPLANDDFYGLPPGVEAFSEEMDEFFSAREVDSRTRYDTLCSRLGAGTKQIDLEAARSLLSSHDSRSNPVCRHFNPVLPWMTIGTSIFIFGASPRAYICPGPPCVSEYTEVVY